MQLKEAIYCVSQEMFRQICIDMDKSANKQYNYYFALVNEIYKGLALCCVAIDIQAYAQIGTLLRQLFEQVATAKIIGADEKALSAYRTFAKAKHYCLEHNNKSELKTLFNQSKLNKKRIKQLDYYSLGWLELIGETEITYETFMKVAQIGDLVEWRKYCNNFVHTNLTYMELTPEGMLKTNIEFIYILSVLFDVICCSYHNVTKFDFKFNGKSIFDEFRQIYTQITEIRKTARS